MDEINKHNLAKKAAIGVALGGTAAGMSAMYNGTIPVLSADSGAPELMDLDTDPVMEPLLEPESDVAGQESVPEPETLEAPEETGAVDLDSLSFSEAFKAARHEVGGGGGIFEWHGKYYNTYTDKEYENLTEEQLDDLYETYKEALHGNTDKMSRTFESSIRENEPAKEDMEPVAAENADASGVAEEPADTDDPEEDEEWGDNGSDDLEDGPSDEDLEEFDFENLYG